MSAALKAYLALRHARDALVDLVGAQDLTIGDLETIMVTIYAIKLTDDERLALPTLPESYQRTTCPVDRPKLEDPHDFQIHCALAPGHKLPHKNGPYVWLVDGEPGASGIVACSNVTDGTPCDWDTGPLANGLPYCLFCGRTKPAPVEEDDPVTPFNTFLPVGEVDPLVDKWDEALKPCPNSPEGNGPCKWGEACSLNQCLWCGRERPSQEVECTCGAPHQVSHTRGCPLFWEEVGESTEGLALKELACTHRTDNGPCDWDSEARCRRCGRKKP